MSTFLGHLGLALIVGFMFGCAVAALAICMRSGQISRDEESGAPEGDITNSNHFHRPDASGLKLSVRASYQSVRSVDG